MNLHHLSAMSLYTCSATNNQAESQGLITTKWLAVAVAGDTQLILCQLEQYRRRTMTTSWSGHHVVRVVLRDNAKENRQVELAKKAFI
jgi:hypothetical protein